MIEGVSACLVTRGNVDLRPIVATLPFDDIVIWDNSVEQDYKVYGRYQAAYRAKHDIIYTQDDDCIVPVEALWDFWTPTTTLLCNMPSDHGAYTDSALVGWGAFYKRTAPRKAFQKWISYGEKMFDSEQFLKDCDVVFTTLTSFVRTSVGHTSFDYAFGEDRMYHQPDHDSSRMNVLNMARSIRDFDGLIEDYLGLEALVG